MRILIITAFIAVFASCSQDDTIFATEHSKQEMEFAESVDSVPMWQNIQKCEHTIDSICRVFRFIDAVGGTDAYIGMVNAYEEFLYCDTSERDSVYAEYMQNYNRCIEIYNEILTDK